MKRRRLSLPGARPPPTRARPLKAWEEDAKCEAWEVDRRLWDDAASEGWNVVPKLRGIHGNSSSYVYIAPCGVRYTSRRGAVDAQQGTVTAVLVSAGGVSNATAGAMVDDLQPPRGVVVNAVLAPLSQQSLAVAAATEAASTVAALAEADAAGLVLITSSKSVSGYRNVVVATGQARPYRAEVRMNGRMQSIGHYDSAARAALAVAQYRALQSQAQF